MHRAQDPKARPLLRQVSLLSLSLAALAFGAQAQTVSFPPYTLQRVSPNPEAQAIEPGAFDDFTITNVAVGQLPWDAAISPDERRAYVLSAGSNEVDVISLEFPRLMRRVFLNAYPTAMALSPDGRELYVGVSAPPLEGYPTDGSCGLAALAESTTSVLLLDTASMAVTASIPVESGLVYELVFGPGGAQLAAATESALLMIDTRTHTAVSIPVDASGDRSNSMQSAVFVSNGTKVFATHVFGAITIFDLTSQTAHPAPSLPAGSTYLGPVIATDPAGKKVFVNICSGTCSIAVLDAASEKTIAVIDDASVYGGALFRPDGNVVFFPYLGDVVDLVTLEKIRRLPMFSVSGAVSPGGAALYLRPLGGLYNSVSWFGLGNYDLASIDTESFEPTGYTQLDTQSVSCSWYSPLRVSATGRYLVAPNPTLNSVSVIKNNLLRVPAPSRQRPIETGN
jgi:DNA-binding beta-propeller fold protein YncE